MFFTMILMNAIMFCTIATCYKSRSRRVLLMLDVAIDICTEKR